jgi:hypothetical protein
MGSSAKKRQTFAKMTRERTVRERRERKLEKKRAAAASRGVEVGGGAVPEFEADGAVVPAEPGLERVSSE